MGVGGAFSPLPTLNGCNVGAQWAPLENIHFFEQCQVVVFVADDLGFLGPGNPDLVTELCPPQDTA